jgi:hypothetical protein
MTIQLNLDQYDDVKKELLFNGNNNSTEISMKSHQQINNRQSTVGLFFLFLFFSSFVEAADWKQWRVEDGGNGHFYEVIQVPDEISWPNANAAALRVNRFSHLATITSQEENNFVRDLLRSSDTRRFGWVGGIQYTGATSPSDNWRWVTSEAFRFTNWLPGHEPNDFGGTGDEIFIEIDKDGYWNDCCEKTSTTRPLYIVESTISANSTASIDIKPYSEINYINPHSRGKIAVAILTTAELDTSLIEANTVRFGSNKAQPVKYKMKDLNYDGYLDLVLKFKTRQTGIACGDSEAILIGETTYGTSFVGSDIIKTVGCNRY